VRTLNGVHQFKQQRYKDDLGKSSYFLESYESKGLREWISYYSNRLSYSDLSDLLERVIGEKPYSESHLQNKVVEEAERVSAYLHQYPSGQQLSLNFVDKVCIYDGSVEEILYLDDGVGVKRQKEERRSKTKIGFKSSATVQTDVIGIGNSTLGFTYLSSAESSFLGCELEELIHLNLSKNYGGKPLPLVAITDGANTIRTRLRRLFGKDVVILLDWYHLEQKIRQHSSRLALDKETKEKHIAEMLDYLWRGQCTEALIYSDVMIQTQKTSILEELQNYLLKHQDEICDYGRRQDLGKCIGSGRGEKANDLLVAHRQKKKAMSWSQIGSNALAVLKSLEINQKWKQYWNATN
jgi:hypothetical protein